jgi:acyl carrier protein
MAASTILSSLIQIVGRVAPSSAGIQTIGEDATLEQLGIDSIEHIHILFEIEEIFGISIDESDFTRVNTLGGLAKLVQFYQMVLV